MYNMILMSNLNTLWPELGAQGFYWSPVMSSSTLQGTVEFIFYFLKFLCIYYCGVYKEVWWVELSYNPARELQWNTGNWKITQVGGIQSDFMKKVELQFKQGILRKSWIKEKNKAENWGGDLGFSRFGF